MPSSLTNGPGGAPHGPARVHIPGSGPRRRTCAGWALLAPALLLPPAAGAQAAPADSLGLLEAVRIALVSSPRVEMARRDVSAGRGGVLAAGAAFDLQMRTFVGSARESAFDVVGESGAAEDVLRTSAVYGAALTKRFRWGLEVSPEFQGSRLGGSAFGAGASNTARGALGLTMPLLRGRGRVGAAGEAAAESSYRASVHAMRHASAEAALATVAAYWDYVAAVERREVYAESEQRARRLVDETGVLVQAEERPPSDLVPLRANVAFQSATRIAAEQEVVEARHLLGLSLGLPAGRIDLLPPPATTLPSPGAEDAPPDAEALAAEAAARRSDVAAAREERRAAELLLRGAEDELRSRMDVSVDVGYTGVRPGNGVGRLFAPIYGSLSGWSAGMELSYTPGVVDRAARGRALRNRALLEQTALAAEELAREVESGVRVAASAAGHSLAELRASEEAVGLYRTSLQSEQEKFRLGMSTLFEVLQAEDALTSARVQAIGARLRYAQAVARLRFQAGTLLDFDGETPETTLEGMTTIPGRP